MSAIRPYSLWLGHAGDGRDFKRILDAELRALVQLAAEEPPIQTPREIVYCRFPLLDGPDNEANVLALAVGTVASLLRRNISTLVCCSAGMSRSPAVAAAALSLAFELSPQHCLEQIASQYPTDVSPSLWNDVQKVRAIQQYMAGHGDYTREREQLLPEWNVETLVKKTSELA